MIITNETILTGSLSLREKIAYGLGDFGSNLMLCIGTLYLLKFYTDILAIPAIYGGLIFLIAKFFTAFTDMLTGALIDSQKINTRGKFRSFIFYFTIPLAIITTLNFVETDFSLTTKKIFATLLFMGFGLLYSLMNCAYGAMVPAITKCSNERAELAAFRQGGATLGLLTCTVAFVPIQSSFADNPGWGYTIAAAIFTVMGIACMTWCYLNVKERYVENAPSQKVHMSSIFRNFLAVFKNQPLRILCLANLCTLAAFNIKLAIQVYYTQYVLNDISMLSYMGFFNMGCILIGVMLVPASVARFGKKSVYIAGLLTWVGGDLLNYFLGNNALLFILFSSIASFGTAFVNSLNWAMVSDTVEYGEWKTGIRAEGTVYTGYTFFRKISAALAGFLPGIMLTMIGYVPNVVQSIETQEGMRAMMFIIPSVLASSAFVAMGLRYKLNESLYRKIVHDLANRN